MKQIVLGSSLILFTVAASAVNAQPELSSDDQVRSDTLSDPQSESQSKPIVPTPAGQSSISQITGTIGEIYPQIKEQDPLRRAGMRANLLRRAQLIVPIVVIVDNPDSYLFAISNWEGSVRFPILWNDGSMQSKQDIARFVRSFKPDQVIKMDGSLDTKWGGNRDQKQRLFDTALHKALDESKQSAAEAIKALNGDGIVSPGMIVTDVTDQAWPAAMALAAGRFSQVTFVTKPSSGAWSPLSTLDADTLERTIERSVRESGYTWKEIGDDIDSITLALNTGTMIKTGPGARDRLATTDRIGRQGVNGASQRWAWCGQIIGNESRSVYQAMCALFLSIDQSFIWDGYDDSPTWSQYDGTEAGETLDKAEFEVEINDLPRNTMSDWKLRTVRKVGESNPETEDPNGSSLLMLMNSKGVSTAFDLPGVVDGAGKPGNMPIFDVPAALHIVHSFSLQTPRNRNTVGGRLIERGVYVYAGSVDEPYLSAFVPTPLIARRLVGLLPFAAAVRLDESKVWKVTVLGDPLVTVGPAGRRVKGNFESPDSINLDERYKQRLKDGDYLGAIEDMTLLGRDESISRVAMALMKEKPEVFTSEIAMASIPSLFRTSEYTQLVDAYERLGAERQGDPYMRDLLWLSSPYLLARSSADISEGARIEALLRANFRSDQSIADAEDLAMHMRKRSVDNAVGVLEELRPTLSGNQLKKLDRAIKRVRK